MTTTITKNADIFSTRNDIEQESRVKIIALLNQQLADVFDLYSQTKQAHWNVKGAHFASLHDLFERMAVDLSVHADDLAERATALGGLALGTVRMSAATSRLPECRLYVTDGLSTVGELINRYGALAASMRQAIEAAESNGDAGTADLFTEVSRALDKTLWFLEAHRQTTM